MSTMVRSVNGSVEEALDWVASRGIRLVHWPCKTTPAPESTGRDPIHSHDLVLYLVAPDARPPVRWSELEDWVRIPASHDEIFRRADRLLMRAAEVDARSVSIDDDGLLLIGERRIVLSPLEERLMRALLASTGEVVPRDDVERAMWPDGAPTNPRALDNRLKALRQRIGPLPLRIHTVRGRGLLLEW